MHSAHRFAFVLAAALSLAFIGCTSTHASRGADDYRAALLAAVTHIERSLSHRPPAGPHAPLTVVISSATPEGLREACSALFPTVYDYDLPDTDAFSLPSQHLKPLSLVITGGSAVFKAILGPVPLPGTPTGRSECGTTYQLQLIRQADGSWRPRGGSTEVCHLLPPRLGNSAA